MISQQPRKSSRCAQRCFFHPTIYTARTNLWTLFPLLELVNYLEELRALLTRRWICVVFLSLLARHSSNSAFRRPTMADSQPSHNPGSHHNRGGRRRGRGGTNQPGQAETQQHTGDNSERGHRSRGRGGGRGRGHNRNAIKMNLAPGAGQPSTGTVEGGGKLKKTPVAAADDADDGEICFICASNVEHTSVSPCNHRTCHICALRLRALYKNKACAHCRVCYKLTALDRCC